MTAPAAQPAAPENSPRIPQSDVSGGVSVRGLSKRFFTPAPLDAVKDVHFSCGPGEVFGLLGPNGAGKSTLLRLLATLLEPDTGEATLNGHDLRTAAAEVRASIGYLSASTGVHGRLTAREMLVYTARLQGVVEPEARAEALLQRFELGPHAHQRNERLSTGNRQKVNIARAIVHDPPIIIFDEPTLGLDVMVSQILLEFVEEARSAGRCVIYSTHIMSEAERLSDRLAIIHGGKVLATGTLDALREQTGARHLEDVFIRAVRRAEAGA